ncbi:glycosyltransferase [Pseudomonas sp. GL-R-19]|uniref:glycosyltransferase n=1 Tax=Pseudomonas sp. GL-R-19 TaxID=2832391 RepID=UPI001CC091AD|nr:glycosyltransferase [Pseudomonas sp. GL-R-19]
MNRTRRLLNVAETAKRGIASYLNILGVKREALICGYSYLVPEAHKAQVISDSVIAHDCGREVFRTFLLAVKLVSAIRQIRFDVILARSAFAVISLCLAHPFFLAKHIKTLYCPHGWTSFRDSSARMKKVIQFIRRAMSLIPRRTVNISQYDHRKTRDPGFSSKCTLIENTVLHAISQLTTRTQA